MARRDGPVPHERVHHPRPAEQQAVRPEVDASLVVAPFGGALLQHNFTNSIKSVGNARFRSWAALHHGGVPGGSEPWPGRGVGLSPVSACRYRIVPAHACIITQLASSQRNRHRLRIIALIRLQRDHKLASSSSRTRNSRTPSDSPAVRTRAPSRPRPAIYRSPLALPQRSMGAPFKRWPLREARGRTMMGMSPAPCGRPGCGYGPAMCGSW